MIYECGWINSRDREFCTIARETKRPRFVLIARTWPYAHVARDDAPCHDGKASSMRTKRGRFVSRAIAPRSLFATRTKRAIVPSSKAGWKACPPKPTKAPKEESCVCVIHSIGAFLMSCQWTWCVHVGGGDQSPLPWQSLNFLPLPQGQGSLRPGALSFTMGWRWASRVSC